MKLAILLGTAVVLIGASAAVAFAEGGGPAILCLVAGCATRLEGRFVTLAKSTSTLETLLGKEMTSTGVEIIVANCLPIESTEEKDTDHCTNRPIVFVGVKSGGVSCNTEGDEAGVVLAKLELHLAAEETLLGAELQPLLLARIIAAPTMIKCGLIVDKMQGTLGCLLSAGLTNIGAHELMELSCKLNKTTHDAEAGRCVSLCEWLTLTPFELKLGERLEDAWADLRLLGGFEKDVFVDD